MLFHLSILALFYMIIFLMHFLLSLPRPLSLSSLSLTWPEKPRRPHTGWLFVKYLFESIKSLGLNTLLFYQLWSTPSTIKRGWLLCLSLRPQQWRPKHLFGRKNSSTCSALPANRIEDNVVYSLFKFPLFVWVFNSTFFQYKFFYLNDLYFWNQDSFYKKGQ